MPLAYLKAGHTSQTPVSLFLQDYSDEAGHSLGCIFFGEYRCTMTWGDAVSYCHAQGAQLAEPADPLQSRIMANLFNFHYPPTDITQWLSYPKPEPMVRNWTVLYFLEP